MSNIPKSWKENDVYGFWRGKCQIEECVIIRDEKKYSRGCAMLKFNSLSKAEEAIQLYDNFQTFTGVY